MKTVGHCWIHNALLQTALDSWPDGLNMNTVNQLKLVIVLQDNRVRVVHFNKVPPASIPVSPCVEEPLTGVSGRMATKNTAAFIHDTLSSNVCLKAYAF